MPPAVKKQVNAVELSGKAKPKRDLHLNGLRVQLRMAYGAYKQRQDSTSKGVITIYPNLGGDVFENNTQIKDMCCSCHTRFDSCLEVCKNTDRSVDIMNGNKKKGCDTIDSPSHPLMYKLLDYVNLLHQRRNQNTVAK